MIRVSSRLTFLYRFVIPVAIIIALTIFSGAAIFVLPNKYNDFYIVALPLVALIFVPVALILKRLRDVFYDVNCIKITDGKKIVAEAKTRDIIVFDRFVFFLYKITLNVDNTTQTFFLLPKIEEAFMTFGLIDGVTIKMFKKRLNQID